MPPESSGNDSIKPRKLEKPLIIAKQDKLITLPSTISILFTGVISIVAIVPLSFSPAIDSGATDMLADANSENIIIGTIIESMFTEKFSASIRS